MNLVASLFAFAYHSCDAAKDAFTLEQLVFVSVEDCFANFEGDTVGQTGSGWEAVTFAEAGSGVHASDAFDAVFNLDAGLTRSWY